MIAPALGGRRTRCRRLRTYRIGRLRPVRTACSSALSCRRRRRAWRHWRGSSSSWNPTCGAASGSARDPGEHSGDAEPAGPRHPRLRPSDQVDRVLRNRPGYVWGPQRRCPGPTSVSLGLSVISLFLREGDKAVADGGGDPSKSLDFPNSAPELYYSAFRCGCTARYPAFSFPQFIYREFPLVHRWKQTQKMT